MGVLCMANLWGLILVAKCRAIVENGGNSESAPLRDAELAASAKKLPEPIWDSGYGYLDKLVAAGLGKRAQLLSVLSFVALELTDGIDFTQAIAEGLPRAFPDLQRNGILLGTGIVFMLLSFTNRLHNAAIIAVLALLTYFGILACLVFQGINHHHTTQVTLEMWRTTGYDYGSFFASANFVFTSLPVADRAYREMQNKSRFVYVATAGYVTSWMFALFVALVGYYGYGTAAEELIYLNFTGSAGVICTVGATVVICVSFVVLEVPLFMFLQARLPGVHYMVVNSCAVWFQVFIAHMLPDINTCMSTLGTTAAIIACWMLPGLTFLSLSHRYAIGERLLTIAVMLLGVVGGVAALASV